MRKKKELEKLFGKLIDLTNDLETIEANDSAKIVLGDLYHQMLDKVK